MHLHRDLLLTQSMDVLFLLRLRVHDSCKSFRVIFRFVFRYCRKQHPFLAIQEAVQIFFAIKSSTQHNKMFLLVSSKPSRKSESYTYPRYFCGSEKLCHTIICITLRDTTSVSEYYQLISGKMTGRKRVGCRQACTTASSVFFQAWRTSLTQHIYSQCVPITAYSNGMNVPATFPLL